MDDIQNYAIDDGDLLIVRAATKSTVASYAWFGVITIADVRNGCERNGYVNTFGNRNIWRVIEFAGIRVR